MSEKRSELKRIWDEVWRLRPCRNELDCRKVVVEVLKQTRNVWNGPDDDGTRFNWSEELPLERWDGIAPKQTAKRITVDGNGMITKLYLNRLGLRGVLPDCTGCLSSLTLLYVGRNQLTRLPDSIGNLTSLTDLAVDTNNLTSIPNSVVLLSSLSVLHLSYNQLSRIPESICNLSSLTKLILSNNQLTHLPVSIGSLTVLAVLYMDNNPMTSTQDAKDEVKRRFERAGLRLIVE